MCPLGFVFFGATFPDWVDFSLKPCAHAVGWLFTRWVDLALPPSSLLDALTSMVSGWFMQLVFWVKAMILTGGSILPEDWSLCHLFHFVSGTKKHHFNPHGNGKGPYPRVTHMKLAGKSIKNPAWGKPPTHGLGRQLRGCVMGLVTWWWSLSRWWFQIFFIFTPIWGRCPIWLIFFRWVETTNQLSLLVLNCGSSSSSLWSLSWWWYQALLYHNPVKSPGNHWCLGCLLKVLPGRAVKVDPPSPGACGAWQAAGCGFTISDLEGTWQSTVNY